MGLGSFFSSAITIGGSIAAYSVAASNPWLAAAILVGTTVVAGQLAPKPEIPNLARELEDRTRMVRQSITNRRILYGQAKVSGPLLFVDSTEGNDTLHLVVAIAGHEIQGYKAFFINDDEIFPRGDQDASLVEVLGMPSINDFLDKSRGNLGRRAAEEQQKENSDFPNQEFTNYRPFVKVRSFKGTDSQIVDPILNSETVWTADHTLSGVAYIYARIKFNNEVFPNGIPTIRCIAEGKKVYDPRTQTTGYTDNAALCLRDYLLDTEYGLGASSDEIDEDSFISGANLADEIQDVSNSGSFNSLITEVNFTGGTNHDSLDNELVLDQNIFVRNGDKVRLTVTGGSAPTGLTADQQYFAIAYGTNRLRLATTLANARAGTAITITSAGSGELRLTKTGEPRYTSNGTINSGDKPKDIINKLLTAQAASLAYVNGKFKLITASYSTPTITFDEDDFIEGINVSPKLQRRDRFNVVKGIYPSPENNWQASDYPTLKSDTFIAQDNETIESDLGLDFTISPTMCQRLAKILLLDSREEIKISATLGLSAFTAEVGDIVYIKNDKLGFTELNSGAGKAFRVVEYRVVSKGSEQEAYIGAEITFKEVSPTVYQWATSEEQAIDPSPNTTLPNAITQSIQPQSLTLQTNIQDVTTTLGSGTIVNMIRATWVAPAGGFAAGYVLSYQKKSPDVGAVTELSLSKNTLNFDISGLEDQAVYEVGVSTVSNLGIVSLPIIEIIQVIGKSAPPPKVESFAVERLPSGVRRFTFSIDNFPADVRNGGGIIIKYKKANSISEASALTYDNLDKTLISKVNASPFEIAQPESGIYKFAAKMVDSSGNFSARSTDIVAELLSNFVTDNLLFRSESDLLFNGSVATGNVIVQDAGGGSSTLTSGGFRTANNTIEAKADPDATQNDWGTIAAVGSAGQFLPSDYTGTASAWSQLSAQWGTIVQPVETILYITKVIDMGASITFTPKITVVGEGSPLIMLQAGNRLVKNTTDGQGASGGTKPTFTLDRSTQGFANRTSFGGGLVPDANAQFTASYDSVESSGFEFTFGTGSTAITDVVIADTHTFANDEVGLETGIIAGQTVGTFAYMQVAHNVFIPPKKLNGARYFRVAVFMRAKTQAADGEDVPNPIISNITIEVDGEFTSSDVNDFNLASSTLTVDSTYPAIFNNTHGATKTLFNVWGNTATFNASTQISSNTIDFGYNHGLIDGAHLVYGRNKFTKTNDTSGTVTINDENIGLTVGTSYYVVNKTAQTIKLATSFGGSAITLTAAGSSEVHSLHKIIPQYGVDSPSAVNEAQVNGSSNAASLATAGFGTHNSGAGTFTPNAHGIYGSNIHTVRFHDLTASLDTTNNYSNATSTIKMYNLPLKSNQVASNGTTTTFEDDGNGSFIDVSGKYVALNSANTTPQQFTLPNQEIVNVQKIATGHFKMAFDEESSGITLAQITAIQNLDFNAVSANIVSKELTMTVGGKEVPAFECILYDVRAFVIGGSVINAAVYGDAIVDIFIKGPKIFNTGVA